MVGNWVVYLFVFNRGLKEFDHNHNTNILNITLFLFVSFSFKINQNIGRLLCTDINKNGLYEVEFVDNCLTSKSSSQESKVYVIVPGTQGTDSSAVKPFGELVAVNGTCSDVGYQAVLFSCIRGRDTIT